MKSILFVFLMSLSTFFPSSNAETNDTDSISSPVQAPSSTAMTADDFDPANPLRISVRAGINFGRRRNNCKGLGICSAQTGVSASSGNTSFHAFATFIGSRSGAVTSVIFKTSSMSATVRQKFFAGNKFVFEEDVNLKLQGKEGTLTFTVAKGPYAIFKTDYGDYELKLGNKGK